jgi:radical SAM superfamily enzyme YgiQ (UPF0313 family)
MFADSIEVIRALRKAGYTGHVTLGGTYPTLSSDFILKSHPEIDSIIRTEGEVCSLKLFRAITRREDLRDVSGLSWRDSEGAVIHNPPQPLIPDLDALPFPARDNFSAYAKMGGIIQLHGSRGCHHNCSFCGTAAFYRMAPGRKWRARSASNIVSELTPLVHLAPTNEVWMTDDNFIGPGTAGNSRALDIAACIRSAKLDIKLIIQSRADNMRRETLRALKDAGLRKVYVGVESGITSDLTLFNKNITPVDSIAALRLIEDEDLFAELGFIGFTPFTTMTDFCQNVAFLERLCGASSRIHLFAFDRLVPYRGTPVWNLLLKEGLADCRGIEYRSVIRDPVIEQVWRHTDALLVMLGPATELIKSLIMLDGREIDACSAILQKNEVFIRGIKKIASTFLNAHQVCGIDIRPDLAEIVVRLNRALGLSFDVNYEQHTTDIL